MILVCLFVCLLHELIEFNPNLYMNYESQSHSKFFIVYGMNLTQIYSV